MAWVSTNEDLDGATAVHEVAEKSFTRVFKVRFDAPATPNEAVRATNVPEINDVHNENGNAFCIRLTPAKVDGSRIDYLVNADYITFTQPRVPIFENPILDPPVVVWGNWVNQIEVTKDKDGVAITNSAKDFFVPPVVRDHYNMQVTITRNEASYDPEIADDFLGTVNNADIAIGGWIISTRNGKMIEFSATDAKRGPIDYKIVRYVIQVNGLTWDLDLLDQGFFERITTVIGPATIYKMKKIYDDEGEVVQTPWRLNGSGLRLATGSDPEFVAYRWRTEENWSLLSLPT